MKAVILAGGRGTRGRPYTDFVPKAMIPVLGRPLVARVAEFLASSRAVSGVVVLADMGGMGAQIRNYMERGGGRGVAFVQDAQSGTGGDLLCLEEELAGESEFLLWFADNLCWVDVGAMARKFRESGAAACVATRSRRREATGFAEVDGSGRVARFVEKPEADLPMPECLGVYVLSAGVLDVVRGKAARKKGGVNLSYDVLEELAGRGEVSAYDIGDSPWVDAESPAALDRNADAVRRIVGMMEAGRAGGRATRTRRSPRRAPPA